MKNKYSKIIFLNLCKYLANIALVLFQDLSIDFDGNIHIDTQQDWNLDNLEAVDYPRYIQLSRKVNTCDDEDIAVEVSETIFFMNFNTI